MSGARARRVAVIAAMVVALLHGVVALLEGRGAAHVVTEDARQHVWWMLRFVDGSLFPGDLLADYYASIAPVGYAWLYRALAACGVDPLLASRLMHLPLALATAALVSRAALRLVPSASGAFVAATLVTQHLYAQDDVPSGTSRAFLYPLFAALLAVLLAERPRPVAVVVVVALLALSYPPFAIVAVALVAARALRERSGRLSALVSVVVALACLTPLLLGTAAWGPTLTDDVARALPTMADGGRTVFYRDDVLGFWLWSTRSGLLPFVPHGPPLFLLGGLLPVLFVARRGEVGAERRGLWLLAELMLISLLLYGAAHLLRFRLYLPSRYVMHTLPLALALASAVVVAVGERELREKGRLLVVPAALALAIGLGAGSWSSARASHLVVGRAPQLYRYVRSLPHDALLAGLSPEMDNLPSFARRSVLVSRETSIPYNLGYYEKVRARGRDLVEALYTDDDARLRAFLDEHRVTHLVLEADAFAPGYLARANEGFARELEPAASAAQRALEGGATPALARALAGCTAFAGDEHIVVEASCLGGGAALH